MGGRMSDRYQQRASIEAAPLEDGMILLDPETNEFSVLNQTASAIWAGVAQPATSEEIATEIAAQFAEVTAAAARSDVEAALREMVERKLITRV
jgi:Coenzyme PQQ synthesis protein D (PqqD)